MLQFITSYCLGMEPKFLPWRDRRKFSLEKNDSDTKKVFIDLKISNKPIAKPNTLVIRVIFVAGTTLVETNHSITDWESLKTIRNYCPSDFLSCNKAPIITLLGELLHPTS